MQNKLLKKYISFLESSALLTIYPVNFSYPSPHLYNQNLLFFFKLLESFVLCSSVITHCIGQTIGIEIFEIRTRIIDQYFIERSIDTTVKRKVNFLQVVQSQLLVELSAKPNVELSMSYKEFFVNILENKAWQQTSHYLIA